VFLPRSSAMASRFWTQVSASPAPNPSVLRLLFSPPHALVHPMHPLPLPAPNVVLFLPSRREETAIRKKRRAMLMRSKLPAKTGRKPRPHPGT
jgi:hypothetical protein